MNCFKLSLGLSLLILIFLVHNRYYLVNVLLCGLAVVLLLHQIINYEKFQSSIPANDFLKIANSSIGNEYEKQNLLISHLEKMLRQMKYSEEQNNSENRLDEGGILIENSCNVEIDTQQENINPGNMPVIDGLDVNGQQMGDL
tara:strand:+ start:2261 stop:2689 length:429 start_codon:yes stop_codon:yes gene_type:complete